MCSVLQNYQYFTISFIFPSEKLDFPQLPILLSYFSTHLRFFSEIVIISIKFLEFDILCQHKGFDITLLNSHKSLIDFSCQISSEFRHTD